MDPLSIQVFGERLLVSGDLDPIYIMLHRAQLPAPILNRWLVAYWCLYHAGAAARIAEAPDFWAEMKEAALNSALDWPRGAERRHWRGAAALASYNDLRVRFPDPEALPSWVANGLPRSCSGVMARARQLQGFGEWIAFKIADMLDRVLGQPVDFSGADLSIYREPAAAADLYLAAQERLTQHIAAGDSGKARLKLVVKELTEMFAGHAAPPFRDRPVNIQEVETIMCKWKSHVGGNYPPGKDVRELRHALEGWGPLAAHLEKHVP